MFVTGDTLLDPANRCQCCAGDGGRPPGAVSQGEAPNRRKLLYVERWLTAPLQRENGEDAHRVLQGRPASGLA